MSNYRADFDVSGTVVLPINSPPLSIRNSDPDFEIIICNAAADTSGLVPRLDVQVIAKAENIDNVSSAFRELLAKQLDILTFVTQLTFQIEQCRRIMEWEPYQKTRAFKFLQEFDPLYPPSPDLPPACIQTAEIISQSNPVGYIQHALHCFRNGVRGRQLEDQFQDFWLAIETVAEGRKDKTKIPISCPKCRGPLTCNHCQENPLRGPLSGQAVRSLIGITVRPGADKIYQDLSNVRNRLMHGGTSAAAAIAKTGQTLEYLVNLDGNIAWHAIKASMPELQEPLSFGHRDGIFANGRLVAGPTGMFQFTGESEHPTDSEIPSVKIEMDTHFRP